MAYVKTTTRAFGSPGKYIQGPGELNKLHEFSSVFAKSVIALIDGFLFDSIGGRLKENFSIIDIVYYYKFKRMII